MTERKQGPGQRMNAAFEGLARIAARWSASSLGFSCAVLVVVVWLASGPAWGYSQTWQLVINTGTTIVTFLMVFLIQRSQSKDALAIQLKLDEIVAALAGASNELVAAEELSEADLDVLRRHYQALSARAHHAGPVGGRGGNALAKGPEAEAAQPEPRRS